MDLSKKAYDKFFYEMLNILDSAFRDSPEVSDWIDDTWHTLLSLTEDFKDDKNDKYLFKLYNAYWADYSSNKLDNDVYADKLEKHYPILNK